MSFCQGAAWDDKPAYGAEDGFLLINWLTGVMLWKIVRKKDVDWRHPFLVRCHVFPIGSEVIWEVGALE